MIIFYDAAGNIVGTLESPLPEVEAQAVMTGATNLALEPEIAARVLDRDDELKPEDLQVVDGVVQVPEALPDAEPKE